MARHHERARAFVRRAPAADEHLALGILTGGHGLELVLGQRGVPAENGLEGLIHGPEEGVDGTVTGRLRASLLATDRQRDRTRGVPAVRRRHAPADDRDRRRDLRRALLDEGMEVGVGDFLLGVGEGHGLAVDLVQRVTLELVAELAELALETLATGQLADGQLAPR